MPPAGLFCTNLKKAVDNSPFSWYNNTRRQGRHASYGGLAQLGERLHGMQEVSGSIPLFSTKKHRTSCEVQCFSFLSESKLGALLRLHRFQVFAGG